MDLKRTIGLRLLGWSLILGVAASCSNQAPTFHSGGDDRFVLGADQAAHLAVPIQIHQPAADLGLAGLHLDAESGQIRHTFSVKKGPSRVQTFRQVGREWTEESYQQGTAGLAHSMQFPSEEMGRLDLLVVIDDTELMPYRENVAAGLPDLLSSIGNTNWRIAVVTTTRDEYTSPPSCELRDVISRKEYDRDPAHTQSRFVAAVTQGETGNPVPRGIEQALSGILDRCRGGPWRRRAAATAVLIATDEANCGSASNESCEDHEVTAAEFLSRAPVGTKVYGFFYDPDICEWDGYLKSHKEYYDLASQSGGSWSPICRPAEAYPTQLRSISAEIGLMIRQEFELDHLPDPSTIELRVDGLPWAGETYRVDGSVVTMERDIPQDARSVEISYRYSTRPIWSDRVLGVPADETTLQVGVNGAELGSERYSFDSSTNRIIFKAPPPDDAQVEVRYRKNDALPRQFYLAHDPIVSSVRVNLDGEMVSSDKLQVLGSQVAFEKAPSDESTIRVEYLLPEDVQTSYEPIHLDSWVDLRVVDPESGEDIPFVIEDSRIVIPAEVAARLERAMSVYQTDDHSLVLPHDPLPGTLEVSWEAGMGGGDRPCEVVFRAGTRYLEIHCVLDKPENVAIQYEYVQKWNHAITVDANPDLYKYWTVSVDGEPIADYQRHGAVFIIPREHLTARSEILLSGRTHP